MRTVRLADVAQINPRDEKPAGSDTVSFVPMADLDSTAARTSPGEPRRFDEVSKGYTIFRDQDLLVAKITPCFENNKIGQAHLAHPVGVGSTEFHVVRPDPEVADASYLLHYMRQDRIRALGERRMTGSAGQRRVPAAFLTDLKVPLPSLEEQRRIAAILDQADALRAKRQQTLAHLDALTRSIFFDMFGDPTRPRPGRWKLMRVSDIASGEKHSIVDGPFGSALKPADYVPAGVPVIRIKNISRLGELVASDLLYIPREKFEALRRSSLMAGDVLVSRVGTLGNTCVFPGNFGDALLSTTGVCKISTERSLMLPEFLHQAIRTDPFQAQIERTASTSVQKYFNLSTLRSWEVIVPPLELQAEFAERLSAIDAHRHRLSRQDGSLEELVSAAQRRAFAGGI